MAERGGASLGSVRDEIAREILRVQDEAYGSGGRIQVEVMDDLVVVLIDVDPARSERTLIDAGHGDAVKATREAFQDAIGATFTAIVERATGRRVASFLSTMSIDPLYAVELFRLAPAER